MKFLLAVDFQNDFVTGVLGTKEAQKAEDPFMDLVLKGDYDQVVLTKDTHHADTYPNTKEGKLLPLHVEYGTEGHDFVRESEIVDKWGDKLTVLTKGTFGLSLLPDIIGDLIQNQELKTKTKIAQEDLVFEFAGVCTDICVVSNVVLLQATFPNARYIIHQDACAGITPESHEAALVVLNSLQAEIV